MRYGCRLATARADNDSGSSVFYIRFNKSPSLSDKFLELAQLTSDLIQKYLIVFLHNLNLELTSVRTLIEQIQLISRKGLHVIGDDVVK